MNKFLATFKAENIYNSLKNIFSRFTFSAFLSIITTIIFIFVQQKRIIEDFGFDTEIFMKIGFSGIIAFFLSVGLYIFGESKKFSKSKNNIFQIFSLIYGVIFFFGFSLNLENFSNFIFIILNIILVISFLFFAPYTEKFLNKKIEKNKKDQENFYIYFSSILFAIFFGFIVSFTFFILTNLGLFTIESLFELKNLTNKIPYIFIISSCFIAPFISLNNIPEKETFENGKFNENSFNLFMIKYLAIPFVFIYFIILYAYSFKVLINFSNWPKGEVSWLVICFSVFGYFTYLISYIYEEKISFVKKFRKIFPFVVFPQIFMLFYAIFLRINQYSLTINRYFVVVFGIWLIFISIYYVFSKRKKLVNIFVLLFIFSSIISIGPWSVYNLPETLQTNLLKKDLKEIGILTENGEITPLKKEDLKEENYDLRLKISGKIDYLCEYHNCEKLILSFVKDVKNLEFKNSVKVVNGKEISEKIETIDELKKFSDWELRNALKDYFNVNIKTYSTYEKDVKEIYLESYKRNNFYKIKGYDFYLDIDSFDKNHIENEKINIANLDIKNKKIEIFINGKSEGVIDISNILEKIIKENSKDIINKLDEEIKFEIENENLKARIHIDNLIIYVKDGKIFEEDNENYYFKDNINGFLFFTKK